MKSMPAGKFKAQCLRVMDEVNQQHSEVIITKRGKPIAKLVPVEDRVSDLFGCMQGTATIDGDVFAPLADPTDWDQA